MSQTRCPECGSLVSSPSVLEGLCSGCLLTLGLHGAAQEMTLGESTPDPLGTHDGGRGAPGHRMLHPMGPGLANPAFAMPAELVRQASRRLALAALGVGLAFTITILITNLVGVLGWHRYSHQAVRNVMFAAVVALSGATAWAARTGRVTSATLLRLGLGYEVVVALGIAAGDNLEPLPPELPLVAISWLCVWIVFFPLVVPAPPRWALLAGLVSATTWPLVYLVGLWLGNPPASAAILALNVLENYIAVSLAMVSTVVLRRLHELGCYQLVERLAHGGMGEIWKARHSMLARPVAVKLIRPELLGVKTPAEAAALVGRFRREAEATATLHSPHTVALHDFGVTPDGTFYYVMELLEGVDLDSLVRRFGPLPPERIVYLLEQACESLADAHAAGLIHRDVKPANIVTCRWGRKWDFVKVLDFGLVKPTWSLGEDDRLTVEDTIRGTPAYIAPEAALGGPLDPRVDLYGLGCVGYWLLTGEPVFAGSSPLEVILHHVRTPPVPPSRRVARAIPEELEALVLSCLAKDPLDRPPSAESLAERLERCRTAEAWTQQRAREWWEKSVPRPGAPPV